MKTIPTSAVRGRAHAAAIATAFFWRAGREGASCEAHLPPSWSRKSLVLLASLVVAGFWCGCNGSCNGNGGPQVNDLQFLNNGVIIEAKTVAAAGQSYGWGTVDLGTVPDIPLAANAPPSGGKFNLWYQTPVSSTEVDLFALDPTGLADTMTGTLPIIELGSGNDALWALLVQTDQFNPPAAAIPFPGPGFKFNAPYPPLTVGLSTSLFLKPNLQPLQGDAALPAGNGSVKAARIYDHGMCSAFQPTFGLFTQIQNAFDTQYACFFSKQGAVPRRTYSHLATQLRHHQNDPTNLSDGFVFDAYYGAGLPALAKDLSIFFNQAYYFFTDGSGFVGIQPGKTFISVNGYDSKKVFDTVNGILHWGSPSTDSSFPIQLDSRFEKALTQDVFGGKVVYGCKADGVTTYPLTCALHHAHESDCQQAVNLLEALVDGGAAKWNLSQADRQALKKAIASRWPYTDGHGWYLSNWRCAPPVVPPSGGPPNTCQFTVPVKRLNVYPDGLELVWFDGKEVNNAAYALFIATFAPAAPPGLTQKLCAFQQVQPGPALSYKRPFASYSEGPANGLADFGIGPGGCQGGPGGCQ